MGTYPNATSSIRGAGASLTCAARTTPARRRPAPTASSAPKTTSSPPIDPSRSLLTAAVRGRAAVRRGRDPAVGARRRWWAAVQLRLDRFPSLRAGAADDVVADRLCVAGARVVARAGERPAPQGIFRFVAPARRADPLGARLSRAADALPDRGTAREARRAI